MRPNELYFFFFGNRHFTHTSSFDKLDVNREYRKRKSQQNVISRIKIKFLSRCFLTQFRLTCVYYVFFPIRILLYVNFLWHFKIVCNFTLASTCEEWRPSIVYDMIWYTQFYCYAMRCAWIINTIKWYVLFIYMMEPTKNLRRSAYKRNTNKTRKTQNMNEKHIRDMIVCVFFWFFNLIFRVTHETKRRRKKL